jgi:hypothetical protein
LATPSTFYFAWTGAGVPFGPEHHIEDEKVFALNLAHEEGQAATLELEIVNPRVGLLSSGRQQWMWLSWNDGTTVHPLFYGRLAAIPDDLFAEVITLKFVARPDDFVARKIAVANTLKVRPWYDPLLVDVKAEADPDTVLEGYSKLWHVDRITHAITVSDVITGEAGTVEFDEGEFFYDSLRLNIDHMPLTTVHVKASVGWHQRYTGTIDLGTKVFDTYTGDALLADWPMVGASLAEGWTVSRSGAMDQLEAANRKDEIIQTRYVNKEKKHADGDVLQVETSWTNYRYKNSVKLKGTLSGSNAQGSVTINWDGVPPDFMIFEPTSVSGSASGTYTIPSSISTAAELRYDADRERVEHVSFALHSDLQPALIDSDSQLKFDPSSTDNISIDSRDVGLPLYTTGTLISDGSNVVDGDTVSILNDIYTFQAVLAPGVGNVQIGGDAAASLVNLINAINVNGVGEPGVDFSEDTLPSELVYASSAGSLGMLATSLASTETVAVSTTAASLRWEQPPAATIKAAGEGNVVIGDTVTVGDKVYTFEAVMGIAPSVGFQPGYTQTPYDVLIGVDLQTSLINLASAINASGGAGQEYASGTFLNPAAVAQVFELTLTVSPRYAGAGFEVSTTSSALIVERTIAILVEDQNTVPIVDLGRRSYLPTDRGRWTLEALICRARAKLINSARAVNVSFETTFEKVIGLSCRHSAMVIDSRLPGGFALGKVKSYSLTANGDDGKLIGGISIACAIGFERAVEEVPGSPVYVEEGYVERGYQAYEGAFVLPEGGAGDITYAPPVEGVIDDGLVFPLSRQDAIISARKINSIDGQQADLDELRTDRLNRLQELTEAQQSAELEAAARVSSLKDNTVQYEILLRPVQGGPFVANYRIDTSYLQVPAQIELQQ